MNLYLIDGNSYVYRAFYAIQGLTNSRGFPTNAIFGFTNMLLKIIRDKSPDCMVVAFDTPEPTERHRLFEGYKAHRPEMPQDLVLQLPYIRNMVSAFNINMLEMPGYEADDIIGTVAKHAASMGMSVFIVTADKDMLQLVDDRVKIYDPMKDRLLDRAYVQEKYGIPPARFVEFLALTGDPSDNIPGIRGVGEKTARALLLSFRSIDELLAHPERIERERLRRLVSENREDVLLSLRLATIDTAVPVDVDASRCGLRTPDWTTLMTLFRELEFSSMMKMIPSENVAETPFEIVYKEEKLREILSEVENEIAFDVETTGLDPLHADLVGVSICLSGDKSYYIPVGHSYLSPGAGSQPDKNTVLEILGPILADERVAKTGHNLKYDLTVLAREGVKVSGALMDTMIASYLLDPNRPNHGLDETSLVHLSRRKKPFTEVLGRRASFADVPVDEAAEYASADAALSFELRRKLFPRLQEEGLSRVYFEIEMPLIGPLMQMERTGVKIDSSHMRKLSAEISVELESLRKRIYFLAGEEFNINSPKQLSSILFDRLGLSPGKKTKTGYSTGMDVLEDLSSDHALPGEVLNYRSLMKLKTTYLDILPAIVDHETGRIHTSFNQTATATGRLSSSEPNLQNIPVRGEWGRRIREGFTADEGRVLLSADYSQVELRILAHLSGDEALSDAFRNGVDVHSHTAAELFGVDAASVTKEMRRTAKTVNFGVIYGISSFGLSEALDIDRREADRYIARYFERHPGVREYSLKTVEEARKTGFAATMFGRKRPIPELRDSNRNVRQQGERLAVNSPIQGTAADIIKVAMINLYRRLSSESPDSRMVLQVHDELLFEIPETELETVREIVRHEMENAAVLSVPLKVEIGFGKNWAAAH